MTLTIPNVLVNGTTADADPVNADFDAVASYVNTNAIVKDGSLAMTGALTLANSTPTLALHAASKGYVDGAHVLAKTPFSQSINGWTDLKFTTEVNDNLNAYNLATGVFTAPASGVYQVSFCIAADVLDAFTMETRLNVNGTTYIGPLIGPSKTEYANFSGAFYVAAAGTITPQVQNGSGSAKTRSVGQWLSITWLHSL